MVWNNLNYCLWRNVCGILCVVSERHINSLPLCLICVISFSSQSSLHFTFHSYLSAASVYYYFPCLCFSVSPIHFIFYSWSLSLWFLFFPIQYLSVSSSVVLLALAFFLPIQHIFIPFCTSPVNNIAGSQLKHPWNYFCAHLFLQNLKILQNYSPSTH